MLLKLFSLPMLLPETFLVLLVFLPAETRLFNSLKDPFIPDQKLPSYFDPMKGPSYSDPQSSGLDSMPIFSDPPKGCSVGPMLVNASFGIIKNRVDTNGRYFPDTSCFWLVTVPPGKIISFTFDELEIEECSRWNFANYYGGCVCDYVSILNGNHELAPLITKNCGTKNPPKESFTTSENIALVRFSTDNTHEWSGFALRFIAIDADNIPCTQIAAISGRKSDIIKSYTCSWSGKYRANEDCRWRITAEPGHVMRFTIKKLDIEQCGRTCDCDSVTIYDGPNSNYKPLAKKCGNSTNTNITYVTSDNQAFVHFKTDGQNQEEGFIFEYHEETNLDNLPCIGTTVETNLTGVIQNYLRSVDGKYRAKEECGWLIQTPKNDMIIRVKIQYLDIEQCDGRAICTCDSISIYGGKPRIWLGTECGSLGHTDISYQAEAEVLIRFTSDQAIEGAGFVISYEMFHREDLPCENLTIAEVEKEKPLLLENFPRKNGHYHANELCDWMIVGPAKSTLVLQITEMDVDDCQDEECGCDYLEIFDSSTPTQSALLARMCGKFNCTDPEQDYPMCYSLNTSGNIGYMRFRTDNTTMKNSTGFQIQVLAAQRIDTATSVIPVIAEGTTKGNVATVIDSTAIIAAVAAIVCLSTFFIVGAAYWTSVRRRKRRMARDRFMSTVTTITDTEGYITPSSSFRSFISELGCEDLGAMIDRLHIDSDKITIGHQLGEGHFGVVYYGVMKNDEDSEEQVAVKAIKSSESASVIAFLKEALIMQNMDHPNVLRLVGVSIIEEHPFIMFPYMENGSLRNYLRENAEEIDDAMSVRFCYQICCGMSYLSKQKCVHRDLACRNVLVNKENTLKIADFGLARDLHSETYYWSSANPRPLPVRWHPPESILHRKFEERSDVWSFGVVCWEIFTKCVYEPYYGMTNREVMEFVCEQGQRLSRPEKCPLLMYDNVMMRCWVEDRNERPSFDNLQPILESILTALAENATIDV